MNKRLLFKYLADIGKTALLLLYKLHIHVHAELHIYVYGISWGKTPATFSLKGVR